MKRVLVLASVFVLVLLGCSRQEQIRAVDFSVPEVQQDFLAYYQALGKWLSKSGVRAAYRGRPAGEAKETTMSKMKSLYLSLASAEMEAFQKQADYMEKKYALSKKSDAELKSIAARMAGLASSKKIYLDQDLYTEMSKKKIAGEETLAYGPGTPCTDAWEKEQDELGITIGGLALTCRGFGVSWFGAGCWLFTAGVYLAESANIEARYCRCWGASCAY